MYSDVGEVGLTERTRLPSHWRKSLSTSLRARVALLLLFVAVGVYVLLAAGVAIYIVGEIFQPVTDAAAK